MDPIDSGQGQDKPPEPSCFLTPSSKGRQRKKNPKYSDYQTDDTSTPPTPRRSSRGVTSKRSPATSGQADNAQGQVADGEIKATDSNPQESSEQTSEETPKKAVRAKRTPRKKTPAKTAAARKTSIGDGDLPAGEGGVGDTVPQQNGTQKRKYVRKRPAQEVAAVTETPCKESQGEPPAEPEEETAPGGRRRRGAAKAALKYLKILANEVLSHPDDESGSQTGSDKDSAHTKPDPITESNSLKGSKGHKGRKRKRADSDSDPAEDEDFVPDVEEEEEEAEEVEDEAESSDSDFRTCLKSSGTSHAYRSYTGPSYKTSNGLTNSIMKPVWEASVITKKFREEHHSSWVFPTWIPSTSDWHLVQQSDVEKYLPQERRSAAFKVSRVGLTNEQPPLQRLGRFAALPAHPERWDMLLFAGGPVWAVEWCPTPESAVASQYIALACHRGMDDQHYVNKTYSGPGLVQLWDVGKLESDRRPDSQPALAYGLAQDRGFIWLLKWCPAGGWEPPSSGRKAPSLPRLGLLAVATSSGVVTIYSLPHPEALLSSRRRDTSAGQQLPIFQADGVLTLKLGSVKAPRHGRSGQVLTMDWLPGKPHNIMAVGFYDGVVGLWDLSTTSALLRVRETDRSLSLLPYRCILAHDHAVRALAFCPASRHLLVTAGEDRHVKTWDLRRLSAPISDLKRFLTNEIYWPMNATGVMLAQENAYVAYGSQGVHYLDLSQRSIYAIPRAQTLWSISYTDWLNSVVTSDILGDVIIAVLPQIAVPPQYVKRTLERRFPVYLTSLEPHDATAEESQDVGGVEEVEEGGAVEEEGGNAGGSDAGSEGGNENSQENGKDGGGGRKNKHPSLRFQTYKEAVKKYYIYYTDNNLTTLANSEKRAVWKRMRNTESKAKNDEDEMPLAALHKVRFSPNLCCHTWLVSGGQAGLVRLICLRSMMTSQAKECFSESQARVSAQGSQKEAVQMVTDGL